MAMARAHEHLERMLTGTGPGSQPYTWQHVLGALQAVCGERSSESEAVLRKAASYEGRCQLDEGAGLPHSMSPEDLLRSIAVQSLAEWDRNRHRDVIARAAALADSEHVAAIARQYLS
jgi:hypothetical protein